MKKMKKIMQLCLALILGLILAIAPAALASQNSMVVPDGTGLAVRTNINNALNTLVTLNSGPSEPSTKYAYMLWADTTAAKLKIRNAANDGWVIIGELPTDRLGLAQVSTLQYASYISGSSATGNDSYAITLSPAPATLVNGMAVILLPDVANTGAASLNLNGLGAKPIKKGSDGALVNLIDNDIQPNVPAVLVYATSSTTWVYVNPPAITYTPPEMNFGLQSVQVFTAGGTWTKPGGITKIVVEVVGGGAGGRTATDNSVGGGGGGGGYSKKLINVSAINSETVTIGAGGAANNAGGTSSFGSHCSATGGAAPGAASTTFTTRAAGGVGSNGNINLSGEEGGLGFVFDQATATVVAGHGGDGGASKCGEGGRGSAGPMTTFSFGNPGSGYGGGGGGGQGSSGAGGVGKGGIVIVWEYK